MVRAVIQASAWWSISPLGCCLSRKDDGGADFSGGIGFMSSASIITAEQENPSEMNTDVQFCESGGEGGRV